MPIFASDTYTDADSTLITAHTGEVGATWTRHASASDTAAPQITSSRLVSTETGKNHNYYASGVPSSADYPVTLDYTHGDGSELIGPGARMSTSVNSGYFFITFSSQVRLYKYVNGGGLTQIGTGVAFTPAAGITYRMTLDVAGTTLKGRVQRLSDSLWLTGGNTWGATQTDIITATDSSLTDAGRAGLWLAKSTGTNRSTIDNFSAGVPSPGPTLSEPVGTSTGATTATAGATTDTATGTMYAIVSTVATAPTVAEIQAGQQSGGTAAAWSGSQAIISTGSKTFSVTGLTAGTTYYAHVQHRDGSSTDSAVVTSAAFTTSAAGATAVTMTGPNTGTAGTPSTNFTVGANGAITGTVTVTPADGGAGGTFTPASVAISSGTPSATFTYTALSAGAKTISATNDGGLTNPANITYTASAAVKYTRIDTTDPIYSQNIMVLVPNANAANPYNAANPTKVIIYTHGVSENETALLSDSLKAGCVDALLDAGYILAGARQRGDNWGNQTAVDDLAGLEKHLRDTYNVAGVALWSQSMGGMSGLNALAQGKFPVVGWLGTYPVCNLGAMHTSSSYTGSINTAYSITGTGTGTYANRTRGMDPALKGGFAYRHVPMRFYASAGDTIVSKANNTDVLAALVAKCCRESELIVCTGNHGHPSHFVPAEYVAFFDRCFATPVAQGRPAGTRTVSVTLTTNGSTPAASLTGLKWAWWDQATPPVAEYPTDKGTAESTDGSGVLSITVNSALSAGGIGWLQVTNSDGNPASDHSGFSGPVQVS
jgi:hypothetical protein